MAHTGDTPFLRGLNVADAPLLLAHIVLKACGSEEAACSARPAPPHLEAPRGEGRGRFAVRAEGRGGFAVRAEGDPGTEIEGQEGY